MRLDASVTDAEPRLHYVGLGRVTRQPARRARRAPRVEPAPAVGPSSATPRHMSMSRVPGVLLFALVTTLVVGCRPALPLAERLERDLLLRQRAALERELALTAEEFESDVVIVIPARLVDELLEIALPIEAIVADRFLLSVSSGRVDFARGLALVQLAARVAWANQPEISADIDILGTLQILDIDESGRLSSRVEILGFETQELRLGTLAPPAGRLLDELARRPVGELNELLERIEIPVQLAPSITLPRVEEDELTIEAVEMPLQARVREARVGGGRLWVHADVLVREDGT
jgi:hypothetical protein